jgi:hypothetical protein
MAMPYWTESEWERVGLPVVERAKREVLADIAAGRVPVTVTCFADLHDHVDANGYGGAFEDWASPEEGQTDEFSAFWNRVQDEVDKWLKAGGHR